MSLLITLSEVQWKELWLISYFQLHRTESGVYDILKPIWNWLMVLWCFGTSSLPTRHWKYRCMQMHCICLSFHHSREELCTNWQFLPEDNSNVYVGITELKDQVPILKTSLAALSFFHICRRQAACSTSSWPYCAAGPTASNDAPASRDAHAVVQKPLTPEEAVRRALMNEAADETQQEFFTQIEEERITKERVELICVHHYVMLEYVMRVTCLSLCWVNLQPVDEEAMAMPKGQGGALLEIWALARMQIWMDD